MQFDNREKLKAWLKARPREVAIAIDARAALRVLPLEAMVGRRFRATAVARAAAKYPTRADELRSAAGVAAHAAAAPTDIEIGAEIGAIQFVGN